MQLVYWKFTYPLGHPGTLLVFEGPGWLSLLVVACTLNRHGYTSYRCKLRLLRPQSLSAVSGTDEPCPLQHALLKAWQIWETRGEVPANSCQTALIPSEITGYLQKLSGRIEKLAATYKSCLINVHFTSAKFYILLLSYVNWAAFCAMINRSLNKRILLLEITLWGSFFFFFGCTFVFFGLLSVLFFFFNFIFQLAISAPNYLLFRSYRDDSDIIQEGISY